MTYTSKDSAAAAARRALRKMHGFAYLAKSGVDFTTSRAAYYQTGWVFDIINESAHRAEATSRAA
jgi:hypothetical protein